MSTAGLLFIVVIAALPMFKSSSMSSA